MNDPHVVALHYMMITSATDDFSNAAPLEHETSDFSVSVSDGRVAIRMKAHFPDERTARSIVDPFMEAWEVESGLRRGPDFVSFVFRHADIVDLKPSPGKVELHVHSTSHAQVTDEVVLKVSHQHYPEPPNLITVTNVVSTMYDRYKRFQKGQTELTSAAYFCLTVLEDSTGAKTGKRKSAAEYYGIDKSVLDIMGELSSTKGGTDSRKMLGVTQPLSPKEVLWLQTAVEAAIWRAGEIAADPQGQHTVITMADLPTLPTP